MPKNQYSSEPWNPNNYNKYQLDDSTDNINALGDVYNKWKSFGFYTQSIDGNDIAEIDQAITNAKANKNAPSMIILNTIKGKGISFVEAAGANNHSMPISKDDLEKALEELK